MAEAGKTIEVPSRRYGTYRIRSRLGAGGMAEVFLAEATDDQGQAISFALKLMRKDVTAESFADEADLMGLLQHPNLVRSHEVGMAYGRPFIAMEFLVGGDLKEVMDAHQRRAVAFPRMMALHVTLEVLRALAYFHQARTRSGRPLGLVHGDVNPSNVFFSGLGEVKLGDFGVAKSRHHTIGRADGVAGGKLHYLSPEQTRGEDVGPASDLFSVGVVFHELVVGTHPFRSGDGPGEPETERVMAVIRAAKLSLPDSVDRPLVQILRKALHPSVEGRYATAGEFAGDLFHYALDHDLAPSRPEVKGWLESLLGPLE